MCGHWWVAESRNAETWPTTFSNYSDSCVTDLPNENLSSGRFGMQETGFTLSMSNSNQKQLLMSLAVCWRSTNASWLCSKKQTFLYVFCYIFCIGLCCCITVFVLFINPNTVHWRSLCICTEFSILMKFPSYWISKNIYIYIYNNQNECYSLTSTLKSWKCVVNVSFQTVFVYCPTL